MNLGDSIRDGAKWLFGGNVASQALQFVFGIVLARLLVPADFGVLVTVQIFTGLAGFIAAGGTGQALIRAKEAKHEDFQVVFTIQFAFGLLIYAVFFATAPLFARWYSEPLYTALFRVSALSFILRPFSNLPNAWLTREMRFKERTVINLVCATLGSIVSVVLAWRQFGVWSLVFGGISGTVLSIIALLNVSPMRPRLRFNATTAKELGIYGVKVTSNDLVSYIRDQTPNFFLGRLEGPGMVGLFNKADSLARTPRIVAGSVYDPVFRSLAKIQDNVGQSQYIYFRTVTLLSVYMTPIFIGLAWLAQPFISFVYGPKWLASSAPLAILSMMGPMSAIGYPSGAVLAAQNWLGREIFVHLTQTVLFAASCIIGIRWGLSGVAVGLLVSECLSVLFVALLVTRCLRSTFLRLTSSLLPGALLNVLLCGTLFLSDLLLPHEFRETRPFTYMLAMTTSGALAYVSAFLLLPIPALASESARWKKKLHIPFGVR